MILRPAPHQALAVTGAALLALALVSATLGGRAGERPGAAVETVKVDMRQIKFLPANVTVPAGGRIVWTNSDRVPHTVTKTDGPGPKFDSGHMDTGATYTRTFDTRGKIRYFCHYHHGQTGTITVR